MVILFTLNNALVIEMVFNNYTLLCVFFCTCMFCMGSTFAGCAFCVPMSLTKIDNLI